MSDLGWVLIVVLGLGVGLGVFFIVRHQRYLADVAAHGWTYDSNPRLEDFLGFQAPPFSLGLGRKVDDRITGLTQDGRQFDSFKYRYADAGDPYKSRLLAIELPAALPTVFVFSGQPRQGATLGQWQLFQTELNGLTALAFSPEVAEAALGQINGALGTWPDGHPVDLSIDGNHLVIDPAPDDPEELAALLAAATPVAAALSSLSQAFAQPPVTPRFSFFGHPDWQLLGSDDAVLNHYPMTKVGFGHSTENLIRGQRDGITMDAFEHHWKTTETRTVSDGRGGSRTETYTVNHVESICGFTMPFDLPALSVNGRRLGEKVQFESSGFNDAFKVRAESARFASDVIHPRMMEWLLANRPVTGWTVAGYVVSFEVDSLNMFLLDACEETLRGFLGRIPRFVWADLGLPVPPFLVE